MWNGWEPKTPVSHWLDEMRTLETSEWHVDHIKRLVSPFWYSKCQEILRKDPYFCLFFWKLGDVVWYYIPKWLQIQAPPSYSLWFASVPTEEYSSIPPGNHIPPWPLYTCSFGTHALEDVNLVINYVQRRGFTKWAFLLKMANRFNETSFRCYRDL